MTEQETLYWKAYIDSALAAALAENTPAQNASLVFKQFEENCMKSITGMTPLPQTTFRQFLELAGTMCADEDALEALTARVAALEELEHVYSLPITKVLGIWTPNNEPTELDDLNSTSAVGMYRVEAGTGTKHIYTGWLHVSDNDDGSDIIQTLVWFTPALGVWERYGGNSAEWSAWSKVVDMTPLLEE